MSGRPPSSVTFGDSFPQRGKPFGRITRDFPVAVMSGNRYNVPAKRAYPAPTAEAFPLGKASDAVYLSRYSMGVSPVTS